MVSSSKSSEPGFNSVTLSGYMGLARVCMCRLATESASVCQARRMPPWRAWMKKCLLDFYRYALLFGGFSMLSIDDVAFCFFVPHPGKFPLSGLVQHWHLRSLRERTNGCSGCTA